MINLSLINFIIIMKGSNFLLNSLIIFFLSINFVVNDLPKEFVYIGDLDKSIKVNLKYFGNDNFIGRRVPHYKANKGIMTKEAAIALIKAQKKFISLGYRIVIYDAYRPDRSVKYFVEWMHDQNDTIRKKYHYPYIEEKKDMQDIYIASRSGHSHGSTVDMTIIEENKELWTESVYEERIFNGKVYPYLNDNTVDCGTSFDLMDPASWGENNTFNFTDKQKSNRKLIKDVMESVGFVPLPEEWWHLTLKNQPYPNKYFDFEIE